MSGAGRIVALQADLRPASLLHVGGGEAQLRIGLVPIAPGTEGVPEGTLWAWCVMAVRPDGREEILIGGGAESASEAAAKAETHLRRFHLQRVKG